MVDRRRTLRLAAFALAVLVAAVVAAWALGRLHENRLEEAFVDATPGAANPAAALQARKAGAYLAAGIGYFFSANSAADIKVSSEGYFVFFAPTQADLSCDFTSVTQATPCTALIDKVSCTDRVTNIPANYIQDITQITSTAHEPVDTNDCRLSIFDSTYAMNKTALMMTAFVVAPPNNGGAKPVFLALPRDAFSTRIFMLLRPSYVRSGLSKLYYVDYAAQGTDGMVYDSWDTSAGKNAVLQLVPVNNPTLDANTAAIEAIVNPAAANPFAGATAAKTGGGGSGTSPAAVARSFAIPRSSARVQMVCYYVNYVGPNQAIPQGSQTPVATCYLRIAPNASQTLKDAGGNEVLSVACGNALSSTLTIVVPGGGSAFTMPALDSGVAAVTVTYNVVIAACVTPVRTSIRRFQLEGGLPIAYLPAPGANGVDQSPDIAQALGRYAAGATNAIPNLADVALRVACLSPAAILSVSEVVRNDTDTLVAESPLRPGQYLVSASGAFKAVFQHDCNLVVYNVYTSLPIWSSSTASKTKKPGALTIGRNDGVLRAFDSMQPQTMPYWVSASTSAPADQAPYRVTLQDNGVLVIKGVLGASPVWASGKGNYGIARLETCEAAAATYASLHAAELVHPSYSHMTPWQHFSTVGQLEGLVWPGPPGPC